MVMGVTQKMLLVAPQTENNQPTPPATDEHGILNEHYEPNTATRRGTRGTNQQMNLADDPYLQRNQETNPQNQNLQNGHFGPGTATTPEAQPQDHTAPAPKETPEPRTLNNYMTRSAYNQLPQNAYSAQDKTTVNMDAGDDPYYQTTTGPTAAPADKLSNSQSSAATNGEPDPGKYNTAATTSNYQYGTGGYANDQSYQNGFSNYDHGYGNTSYQTDLQSTAPEHQGATDQGYGYYDQYADQSNDTGTANYGATDYGRGGYATQPMGYDAAQTNEAPYDDADADDYDDYEDDRGRGEDLSFFQKIGVLDWITAGLSLILIMTTFVGGFISSGTFGSAGTTSSTLYKTMSLGGSTFKVTMILLLFLLMIGPLLLITFSIWKIHAAYIIKLAAAVVSILAYIAVFGILISKGIVAASGLQNFQFGISAIVAIVLLIVNFILSVIEFVKY